MAIQVEQEVGPGARPASDRKKGLPGIGLLKGLGVTLKHMLQPSITQEYPDEKPDLPSRSRGVIALKQENCTVTSAHASARAGASTSRLIRRPTIRRAAVGAGR